MNHINLYYNKKYIESDLRNNLELLFNSNTPVSIMKEIHRNVLKIRYIQYKTIHVKTFNKIHL